MADDFDDINEFEQTKQNARAEFAGRNLRELVQTMDEYRIEKEKLEADLKVVNACYDVLRFELVPERMEADGVERIVFDGIGRVQTTGDALVSIKAGAKEQFYDWLRANRLESLIVPQVNASTLKAWVKERIKKALPYPAEMLNVTPITRASITRESAKKTVAG